MDQPTYLVADFTQPMTLLEIITMRNKLKPGDLRDQLTEEICRLQAPVIEKLRSKAEGTQPD